jgi:ABC-2 type transport system permease protein
MKYLTYTRAEFLRGMRYRANYWATLTGSFIMTIIQWSLWTAVYRHTDSIAGIGLSSMLSYTLMGRVTSGLLAEPSSLRIGPRVRRGTIVHDLVKPTDLHYQLLFQSLGSALFRLVSTGLPLLLVLLLTGNLRSPGIEATGAFVLSLFMGYITVFSTSFVSGVLTFYTKSGVGIDHLYSLIEFLSGMYVPLQFFPGWLRAVAERLPFKAIHYIPMAIWSGMTAPGEVASAMLSQVAWTALMVLLCRVIWSRAVKHLTVQGG